MVTYPPVRQDEDFSKLLFLGFLVIIIGFIILFISSLYFMWQASSGITGKGEVGIGGCIVVFFIPICFGAGSPGLNNLVLILAIVMTIIVLLVFLAFRSFIR